jgi:hypothetical protein
VRALITFTGYDIDIAAAVAQNLSCTRSDHRDAHGPLARTERDRGPWTFGISGPATDGLLVRESTGTDLA